ncbi:sigma-70 family RNA polymerase sigma factor [Ruania halotolerans]|uniref:sigma-70 family RNA polymerase sigma factor n=1 Tax=Ruania halotolerans TaxID=2897773 RepID=UPI001E60EF22|nr:sigma-70 family RNA polymerase sigma factor [Ruania halotolerans]UFU06822.1 sigma-70 family RNA polymerase sigma factor [Ruania halotolerans]
MTAADPPAPLTAADRAALLARSAGGDREAFAALYDDVASLAFGVAVRIVRDRDLAADVTQEAMVEVWRTAARYRPESGPVTAWVALLTRRRAVDRVRAEQSYRDRTEKMAPHSFDRPFDEVSETVVGRDQARAVQNCLGTLTDRQRTAVERAFYGGLTYREVAQESGAALPTVKSRIRDGLLRLRDCLGFEQAGGAT